MVGLPEFRLAWWLCSVWKGISKCLNMITRFSRFRVNNGERMLFWMDLWCSNVPLFRFFRSSIVWLNANPELSKTI